MRTVHNMTLWATSTLCGLSLQDLVDKNDSYVVHNFVTDWCDRHPSYKLVPCEECLLMEFAQRE